MSRVCILFALLTLAPAWGANLIVNSSFEYWLFGSPVGWVTSNAVIESTVVRDTNAHTGRYCALLRGADTSAFVTTTTIVRPGIHYQFGAFCRVPGILPASFVLQFTTLLADPIGNPIIIPAIYSGRNYREYTRWVTAPESAFFLVVTFATLPHATAYLDDVTLEDTTFLGLEEKQSTALPIANQTRKIVVPAGCRLTVMPGMMAYDITGRRFNCSLPGGIYFLTPKR
ncbi:MAG: hypothetical protein ABIL25_00465 [candidate division WOR-3 bacterium]